MKRNIGNTTTSYQLIGEGAQTLVLLHGWLHSWQAWSALIPELSNRYQLLIPDLPGFGESEIHDDVKTWLAPKYATWLNEFLTTVVPDKEISIAGHSFGGKIAALLASQQPKINLKHLVLIDSAGLPVELSGTGKIKQRIISAIPNVVKDLFSTAFKENVLEAFNLATDNLHSLPHQKTILRQTIREDISGALQKIEVPTTLIWGEKDLATPLEKGKEMAQLIPNSNLIIIPDASHTVPQTSPQECLKILLDLPQ